MFVSRPSALFVWLPSIERDGWIRQGQVLAPVCHEVMSVLPCPRFCPGSLSYVLDLRRVLFGREGVAFRASSHTVPHAHQHATHRCPQLHKPGTPAPCPHLRMSPPRSFGQCLLHVMCVPGITRPILHEQESSPDCYLYSSGARFLVQRQGLARQQVLEFLSPHTCTCTFTSRLPLLVVPAKPPFLRCSLNCSLLSSWLHPG